ncbi:hypothetical protein J6590_033490 [Homalodisca vitripennis]|nr:hypothetical protein J6590_033490 [Homalodisca vitripennis]
MRRGLEEQTKPVHERQTGVDNHIQTPRLPMRLDVRESNWTEHYACVINRRRVSDNEESGRKVTDTDTDTDTAVRAKTKVNTEMERGRGSQRTRERIRDIFLYILLILDRYAVWSPSRMESLLTGCLTPSCCLYQNRCRWLGRKRKRATVLELEKVIYQARKSWVRRTLKAHAGRPLVGHPSMEHSDLLLLDINTLDCEDSSQQGSKIEPTKDGTPSSHYQRSLEDHN